MPPKIDGAAPVRTPAPPAATLPAQAVDVSKIDLKSAEFKALTPAFQKAVTEAKAFAAKHFAAMAPAPKVMVTAAPSNGSAPVTVVVPPGAKEPISVQTHYHGDRATAVGGENAFADEVGKRVKAGDNTVYVLPESNPAAGRTDWNNAKDLNGTTTEALTQAGLGDAAIGHTTLSVHSAGGRALANAIKDGQTLKADELLLQDALFEGNTGPGAHSALRKTLPGATTDVKQITIIPSQETSTSAERSKQLADDLKAKGRSVTIAPATKTHAAAAGVLEGPAAVDRNRDHFVG